MRSFPLKRVKMPAIVPYCLIAVLLSGTTGAYAMGLGNLPPVIETWQIVACL